MTADATNTRPLNAESFWIAVARCSCQALRTGALLPISTYTDHVVDRGVEFVVRVSNNLLRKEEPRATYQQNDGRNPFLPPDPQLTIGILPPHHVAVLNKFNVLDNHALVVTRGFVHQECPLTGDDFSAVAPGLVGGAGLAFYNAGRTAGASQPHKHFQLVPLPMGRGTGIPMDSLFEAISKGNNHVEAFSFRHFFTRLDADPADASAFGRVCLEVYTHALRELELVRTLDLDEQTRLPPYNLLLTAHWLFLVPRSTERFRGISVNGLGYAGSLFVSSTDKLKLVKSTGPMTILEDVSVAN